MNGLPVAWLKGIAALAIVSGAYAWSRPPGLAAEEREQLSARFRFSPHALAEVGPVPARTERQVNPSYAQISAWISAVGAGVALADLDDDGLPNDVCHVDPRNDRVTVAPAPGTAARYAPFALGTDVRESVAPMGCLPADVNEDGALDLVVYYWGRPPTAHLRSSSATALAPEAYLVQEIAAASEAWYTNALTQADVDGDGHLDLVVGNYFPEDARVLDARAGSPSYMQTSMSHAQNGGRNRLLLWRAARAGAEPSVQYVDASEALDAHAPHAWTLAIGAASIDDDLLPELYFGNDFASDRLVHNRSTPGHVRLVELRGERELAVPKSKTLGTDSFKGMGVDFGDLNADGKLDIFVSNIASEYSLEESHFLWQQSENAGGIAAGIAPFRDHSEDLGLSRSGWGWDARLADFDNDGWLEVIQATGFLKGKTDRWPELHELAMGNDLLVRHVPAWPRIQAGSDLSGAGRPFFFARASDGRYHDIAQDVGIGALQIGRGVATADVDGDGRLDVALANQWGESFLYRNESPGTGAFLGLRLLLPVGGADEPELSVQAGRGPAALRGTPAVGATVRVQVGDRELIGTVDGGNGHSGKRSPELLFGLGAVSGSDTFRVQVRWRARSGEARSADIELRPGWNTVWLGRAPREERVAYRDE